MNRSHLAIPIAGLLGLALGTTITSARAQEPSPKPLTVADFPNLIGGLKATPGCLGAEAVAAKGGKQLVLMAWFKDKKAVEAWYSSKMHVDAMQKFFPNFKSNREPLSLIKDPTKPILVIASVTPSAKPAEGQTLAASQIAIEMYTPVPGGFALGSSFAPNSLDVEGLVRIPTE